MPGLNQNIKDKFVKHFLQFSSTNSEHMDFNQEIDLNYIINRSEYRREGHVVKFRFPRMHFQDFDNLTKCARDFYFHYCDLIIVNYRISWFNQTITFFLCDSFKS